MRKHLPAALFFFVATLLLTFPLIIKPDSYIPGFFFTDEPYGNIWEIWRINYSLYHNLSLGHTQLMCYPFGFTPYADGYIAYLWISLVVFLSKFTQPLIVYNMQLLLNMFFSGLFAYLLAYYVTGKNRYAGIFTGIIFAFCPYQFSRLWQHLGLTYSQWIPLSLLAAIYLKFKPSKKSIALLFLSLILLFSFDWSVMYFTFITLAVFIIYCIYGVIKNSLREKKNFMSGLRYIYTFIGVSLLVLVLLSFQFIPMFKNVLGRSSSAVASAHNPYHRPFEDLFAQSARPLSYLLPATSHPVFGKFTEQFIGSTLYGVSLTEHTLYLGWVPIILALYAIRRWRRDRKGRKELPLVAVSSDDFYIGYFIFLALVAWLFSQPPWWQIGSLRIYMPSSIMYKILPMFRAYCRFGIVVMLAVAVLAGFGLKLYLERFRKEWAKIAFTILFSGFVLFEFWNWPPFKVIDLSKFPAVYYWLKEQPEDVVIAEYPLDTNSPNEMYKFYQTKHEKKIINGTIPGTEANKFAQKIVNLSNLRTAGLLKWMGVKYVLVHIDEYKNTEDVGMAEELNKISKNHGLKLIGNFVTQECQDKNAMCIQKTGPIDLYEVIASPTNP